MANVSVWIVASRKVGDLCKAFINAVESWTRFESGATFWWLGEEVCSSIDDLDLI